MASSGATVVSALTFISLRDYAGDVAGEAGPVARFAEYLGRIVAAALAYPAGPTIPTAIRCRRRPGHRPCRGYLDVTRLDIPREIRWHCPECGDRGIIRDWHGTPWDRHFPQSPLPEEASFWLVVNDEEMQALARLLSDMSREGARMVAAGLRTPEGIILAGEVDAFMAVADAIRLALLDGVPPSARRLLTGLLDRVAMVVADGGWK